MGESKPPVSRGALERVLARAAELQAATGYESETSDALTENQVLECCGEFMVRTRGDAAALTAAIKQTLRDIDPRLPLINPGTLRDVMKASIARQQVAMALVGAFAALALVIAVLGVYSVMAYAVIGRTREFGIRQALGASDRSILDLLSHQVARVKTKVGSADKTKIDDYLWAGAFALVPLAFFEHYHLAETITSALKFGGQ